MVTDRIAIGPRSLGGGEGFLIAEAGVNHNGDAAVGPRLVESAARAQGLSVDPDALEWIVERLGGDRGQSRSEIDKLLLYKQGDGAKTVSLDDALAVLGDTAAIGIDDVVAATFDGELVALDRALDRVFAEGGNPVQLVRALQRHTDQLHLVAGHAANGGNLEGAMFKARGLPRGGPVRQRPGRASVPRAISERSARRSPRAPVPASCPGPRCRRGMTRLSGPTSRGARQPRRHIPRRRGSTAR